MLYPGKKRNIDPFSAFTWLMSSFLLTGNTTISIYRKYDSEDEFEIIWWQYLKRTWYESSGELKKQMFTWSSLVFNSFVTINGFMLQRSTIIYFIRATEYWTGMSATGFWGCFWYQSYAQQWTQVHNQTKKVNFHIGMKS